MEVFPSFDVPVLLIMFNRPELAIKVFERISLIRPAILYLAVDGPRHDNSQDVLLTQQCKELLGKVDWPCEVNTLFRQNNLGCKYGVSSAIDWFFEKVAYGIILEDDCLPDPSFFTFCRDLLLRYVTDERVMHIGGTNLIPTRYWTEDSYFFSPVCHIWGWATWKRAWQHYDVLMASYPKWLQSGGLKDVVHDNKSRNYWKSVFNEAYKGNVDTWDYQWVYTIWKKNGLCIMPKYNMISNIGFGEDATHTKGSTKFSNLQTTPILSISTPSNVSVNVEATDFLFRSLYRIPPRAIMLVAKIRRYLSL